MDHYHFFDISFVSLNLFSFMAGMTWAFFNQGIFGKRIALPIFLYFAGLAAWYALNLYAVTPIKKVPEPTEQSHSIQKQPKRQVSQSVARWTVSDHLPHDWEVKQEHLDTLIARNNNVQ